ncbi:MAG: hypothetical protein JNL12_14850 [Planctomycetes bacterium]|nr:hypothetical protein [Planctomycetota bacterium]
MTIEPRTTTGPGEGRANPASRAVAWLRRQQKRNLLLLGLVPLLVWLWLPLLSGDRRRPTPAPATVANTSPTVAPVPGTAFAAPLAEGAGPQVVARQLAALTAPYQPRWHEHDDPAPFRSTAPGSAATTTEAGPTNWTPTTVVLSDGMPPLAVVQGRPRRIGDRLGPRELVAIEEHRIVWREGAVLIPVALPGPTGDPR